jgi:tripartite-type tricarboxylate transporter receptor subunit TctC
MTVKQAAPDGTTLFLCDLGSFGINLSLISDLGYDPLRDFKPISPLWAFPSVLSVPASLPAASVKELVELAKKTPNGMSFGSQGVGSGGQILGAMLAKSTGAPLVHVPYKGAAPAITDLVAGQVAFLFGSVASVQGHFEAKRLRALAVTSPRARVCRCCRMFRRSASWATLRSTSTSGLAWRRRPARPMPSCGRCTKSSSPQHARRISSASCSPAA